MKLRTTTFRCRAGGFTLLELLIVVALLGVVLGSVGLVSISNDRAYRTGTLIAHLESQSATAIDKVVTELSIVGNETLDPAPAPGVGVDSIQYMQANGITDGRVDWSPRRRLAFEYEIGELDDGADNNRNGLVDEGQLVLTEDLGGPNEHRRVLTRWVRELVEGEEQNGVDDNDNGLVDEHGFVIERSGETLVVRLTLERLSATHRHQTRTAMTSIRLRN